MCFTEKMKPKKKEGGKKRLVMEHKFNPSHYTGHAIQKSFCVCVMWLSLALYNSAIAVFSCKHKP